MPAFLKKFIQSLSALLNKGHARSVRTKKNIVLSLGAKGMSIAISLLMVPLTLDYLDNARYGIWLTISSFVGWFSFFDVGLGHGLRNRFAEALAKGKYKLARIYVSTTYAILGMIMLAVGLLFAGVSAFVNWTAVFNAPAGMEHDLRALVLMVFSFFCIQFVLDLIGVILSADQQPALNDLFRLISSAVSLLIIYVLTKTSGSSLLLFGLSVSGVGVVIFLLINLILFNTKYKKFAPAPGYVRFRYARNLLNLGVQFFVIQILWIIIYSTDNIIITQLYGPEAVGPYNIAFRYFGMATMLFNILTAPLWSAYTEAYVKQDFDWITGTIRKMKLAWLLLAGGCLLLLLISPYFYKFWIKDKMVIPFALSFWMCIYVIAITWGSIFVIFLNGIGKVRMQLYFAVFAGILNIPLCILFAKTFGLGSAGVIVATIICMSYGPLLAPIQYSRIMKGTAKGIWNK